MIKTNFKIFINATLIFTILAFESYSQVQILRAFSVKKNYEWQSQKKHADSIADKHHFPKIWISEEQATELQRLEHGQPIYYQTENINAAATISSNRTWPENGFTPGLSGSNTTAGIWDGGYVLTNHREFLENIVSRVVQHDAPSYLGVHATHLSGTMIAKGVNVASRGMANAGHVFAYDFNNDLSEMASEAADGLQVSNHSYGPLCGWSYNSSDDKWYWHGDLDISAAEDPKFGLYTETTQAMDFIAFHAPEYLIIKSAGNDRNDAPGTQPIEHYIWDETWKLSTMSHDPDGGADGFDCLSPMAIAKNVLTIGAIEDLPNGYITAGEVQIASFSSYGPTDDGRIKPDLVANGISILSCGAEDDAYLELSGTSMSAASITGSVLLLNELQEILQPGMRLKSSTLKALLIHTADECGPSPGPDYQYGWGLANIHNAANVLKQNYTGGGKNILETSIAQGEVISIPITIPENTPQLKASICWTDHPADIPPYALNNPTSNLVNNLDIKIIEASTGKVYYPWILDPANPTIGATKGINNRDNIEQVLIDAPAPGEYQIKISHQDNLENNLQAVSLIISGLSTENGLFPPENLAYYTGNNVVNLMWEQGQSNTCDHYNVYRNGHVIASTSGLYYSDQSVQNGTTYSYFITAAYSGGDESISTNIILAKPLLPKSMPYTMNCESGLEDWTVKADISGWRLGDSDSLNCYYLNFSSNTGHFLGIDSYTAGEGVHVSDLAMSPPINMANHENITLSFDYMLITGIYGTTNDIKVIYRQNEASDWITLATLNDAALDWKHFSCAIPPDAAVSGFQVAFRYDDHYLMGMGAGLDNIQLSGTLNITEDISLESINSPVSPQCYIGNALDLSITIKNTGNTIIQSGQNISIGVITNGIEKNVNYVFSANLAVGATRNISYPGFINALPAGSNTLSVSLSWTKDQNPENNTKVKTIVVNPLPEIVFTDPPEKICEDAEPVTITATPTGGTFESDFMTGNQFDPTTAGLGDHIIIYTYQDANNCVNSASISISVIPLPVVSFTGLSAEYCVNDAHSVLSGTPSDGTFFGTGISGNTFAPELAGAGTHVIEYRYTDQEGCSNTASHTTTVFDITPLSFTNLNDDYCTNSPPIELQAIPAGGSFTIDGEIAKYLDPKLYEPGSVEINYSLTNANGCQSNISKQVTLNSVPEVSFTGLSAEYCVNDAPSVLSGTPSGGTFFGPGISENTFVPELAGAETHVIEYQFTNQEGCSNTASHTTKVFDITPLSFTNLNDAYCINSPPIDLQAIPAGGSFTIDGEIVELLDPKLYEPGYVEINYSLTNTNGCKSIISKQVNLYNVPDVSITVSDPLLCFVDQEVYVDAQPSGGIFSGNLIEDNLFNPLDAGVGFHDIIYIYKDEFSCQNSDTITIEVTLLPIVSFTGLAGDYCINGNASMLTGTPSVGSFSGSGIDGNYFNPQLSGPGTSEIIYSFTDQNGCTNTDMQSTIVYDTAEVHFTNISDSYCQDSEAVLLSSSPEGGTFYINNIENDQLVPMDYEAGSVQLSYYYINENNCVSTIETVIEINPLPETSILGLHDVYCLVDENYALSGVPEGGFFILNDDIISQINPMQLGADNYELTYQYTNQDGCKGMTTEAFEVTANPEINIRGLDLSYCPDSESVSLEGVPVGGSFDGPGIFENTFSPGILAPGTYIISYSYNLNGCHLSTTASATITEITDVSIEGLLPEYCPKDSLARIEGTPQGGTFEVVQTFDESPNANTYDLYYTFTNEYNCSFSDSERFQVYKKPDYAPPDHLELNVDEVLTLDLTDTDLNYFWPEDSTSKLLNIIGENYSIGKNILPVDILDAYGCVNEMEIKFTVIGITAISESDHDRKIEIFPNPAKSYIKIQFPEEFVGEKPLVSLFDLNGKMINQWKINNEIQSNIELDVSLFIPGVYLLKIADHDDYIIKKISIVRN